MNDRMRAILAGRQKTTVADLLALPKHEGPTVPVDEMSPFQEARERRSPIPCAHEASWPKPLQCGCLTGVCGSLATPETRTAIWQFYCVLPPHGPEIEHDSMLVPPPSVNQPPVATPAIALPDPTLFRSLAHAQEWLRGRLEVGATCPCCSQRAQIYCRRLHAQSTAWLIDLVQKYERTKDYVHVNETDARGGDYAKNAIWGLCVRDNSTTTNHKSSGRWMPTRAGIEFVYGQRTIRKTALVFDSKVIGFTGPEVDVKQCLGKRFNYAELMRGLRE